jgi:hypothetical protein
MAKTDRPRAGSGRKSKIPVERAAGEPQNPIHSAIDTIFQNDASVREALSNNLRDRSTESLALANRAQDAFAGFSASRLSAAERARPNYLAPGDDLADAHAVVVTKGTEAFRTSNVPRSIRLRSSEALRSRIKAADGNDDSLVGTIEFDDLVDYIAPNGMLRPARRLDPTFTACIAEVEAEKRLKQIKAAADGVAAAVVPEGGDGPVANGSGSAATDTLVEDEVSLQMKTATSPESQLLYGVPNRPDQGALQASIQTFELRSGPSDVTSYHDFNSLQIAFEPAWTEIFHGQLAALGKELYGEYVKLKVFAGIDNEDDRPINTIDDLSQLMDDVRNLGRITQDVTPGDVRPNDAGVSAPTADAAAKATDYAKAILDPASIITDNIGNKTVAALVDPAGAIYDAISALFAGKPHLNWSSFPGPLPVNGDIISVRFDSNAVPSGEVEIVLHNSPAAWWWKGIEYREFDATGKVVSHSVISNDPQGNDASDPRRVSFNVLRLYTTQLPNGLLEFQKAAPPPFGFGIHTGYYLLAGLDASLKDRMRVTFTWEKDS